MPCSRRCRAAWPAGRLALAATALACVPAPMAQTCPEGTQFQAAQYAVALQDIEAHPRKYFDFIDGVNDALQDVADRHGMTIHMDEHPIATVDDGHLKATFTVTAKGKCVHVAYYYYLCWNHCTVWKCKKKVNDVCESRNKLEVRIDLQNLGLTVETPVHVEHKCQTHYEVLKEALAEARGCAEANWCEMHGQGYEEEVYLPDETRRCAERGQREETSVVAFEDGAKVMYQWGVRHVARHDRAHLTAIHGAVFACVQVDDVYYEPAECRRDGGPAVTAAGSTPSAFKNVLIVKGSVATLVFDAGFSPWEACKSQEFSLILIPAGGDPEIPQYKVHIQAIKGLLGLRYYVWIGAGTKTNGNDALKPRIISSGGGTTTTWWVTVDQTRHRIDYDCDHDWCEGFDWCYTRCKHGYRFVIKVGYGSIPGKNQLTSLSGGSARPDGAPGSFEFQQHATKTCIVNLTGRICQSSTQDIVGAEWTAFRFATTFLAAMSWAHARQFRQVTVGEKSAVFDATLNSRLNLTYASLGTKQGWFYATASQVQLETTCAHREGDLRARPLLAAHMAEVVGQIAFAVRRVRAGGELEAFVEFARTGEGLGITKPILQHPLLAIPQGSLQKLVDDAIVFFRPSLNFALKNGGIVIPESVAKYLPRCDEGRCQGISQHPAEVGNSQDEGYVQWRQLGPRRGIAAATPAAALMELPYRRRAVRTASDSWAWLALQIAVAVVIVAASIASWCCGPRKRKAREATSGPNEPGERRSDFVLYCLGVYLLVHSCIWRWYFPFADFRHDHLARIGTPDDFDLGVMDEIFDSWWVLGSYGKCLLGALVLLIPCIEYCFPSFAWMCECRRREGQASARVRAVASVERLRHSVRMLVPAAVLLQEFFFMVGFPLTTKVGRRLATQPYLDDPARVGDAASLISLLSSSSAPEAMARRSIDISSTLLSTSFTGIFVPFVGAYFVFAMLAMPIGMQIGNAFFALQYWDSRHTHAAIDMGVALQTWVEIRSGAAVLGPFVITYQIFASSLEWWWPICVTCLLRPCVFIRANRAIYRSSLRYPLACTVLTSLSLANALIALVSGLWLWLRIDDSLKVASLASNGTLERMLHIDGVYVLFLAALVVGCMAWWLFLVLESQAGSNADLAMSMDWVERVVSLFEPYKRFKALVKVFDYVPWTGSTTSWVTWALSMDALGTLVYHAWKCAWLGFATGYFSHEVKGTPRAVIAWLQGFWQPDAHLAEVVAQEPQVTVAEGPTWSHAGPAFLVSCMLGWLASLCFQVPRLAPAKGLWGYTMIFLDMAGARLSCPFRKCFACCRSRRKGAFNGPRGSQPSEESSQARQPLLAEDGVSRPRKRSSSAMRKRFACLCRCSCWRRKGVVNESRGRQSSEEVSQARQPLLAGESAIVLEPMDAERFVPGARAPPQAAPPAMGEASHAWLPHDLTGCLPDIEDLADGTCAGTLAIIDFVYLAHGTCAANLRIAPHGSGTCGSDPAGVVEHESLGATEEGTRSNEEEFFSTLRSSVAKAERVVSDEALGVKEEEAPQPDEETVHNYRRYCGFGKHDDLSMDDVRRSCAKDLWASCKGPGATFGAKEEQGRDSDGGVWRLEFMLVGLGHMVVSFVRSLMDRDARPHVWGMSQDGSVVEQALVGFHESLSTNFDMSLPPGNRTAFDYTFVAFDRLEGFCALIEAGGIVVLCGALYFHCRGKPGDLTTSQWCIVLVGALMALSVLLPLIPDYTQRVDVTKELTGCAPGFDAFVSFGMHGIFGTVFAAFLGLRIFGLLFALPISVVRGIWLMLWYHHGEHENANETDILQGILLQLACTIPLDTVFPLLFCIQLSEDDWATTFLILFWFWSPAYIFSAFSRVHKFQFYFWWVLFYSIFFGLFVWRHLYKLEIDAWRLFEDVDWPKLWSVLHSDFCVMSVLITDVIAMTFEGIPFRKKEEVSSEPMPMEEAEMMLLVTRGSVSEHDMRGIPRPQEVGMFWNDGMGALTFRSAEASREFFSTFSHPTLQLVPMTRFIQLNEGLPPKSASCPGNLA